MTAKVSNDANRSDQADTAHAAGTAGVLILNHYLVDLSVENPGGRVPDERAADVALGMEVSVSVQPAPGAPAGLFGVQVSLGLTASLNERVVFLIELRYGVVAQLKGISDPALTDPLLYVQVPTAIFPQLKSIVEQNGAFAGYPELTLREIDFAAHFNARAHA